METAAERESAAPAEFAGWVTRARRHLIRRLSVLPPMQPLRPIVYTPGLLAYAGGLLLTAIAIAVTEVRPGGDWTTIALGGFTILVVSGYSVETLSGVDTTWSVAVFVQLGMTFALGPTGALVAAVADSLVGLTIDRWFRIPFNIANQFVSNMAGWWAFHGLAGDSAGIWRLLGAGIAGSFCQWLVNSSLLGFIVKLNNSSANLLLFARVTVRLLGYSLGFGWSAVGFVLLHQRAGAVGFTLLLLPVLLLQGLLVLIARGIHASNLARAQHAGEREELFQRIIEASEEERRRIASDLHDGPVQNLAGAAFTLSARARRLRESGSGPAVTDDTADVMDRMAAETRHAMRDLRTLIIQIAPPSLDNSGLERALADLLGPLRERGVIAAFAGPADPLQLSPDRISIVFRVAQEAVRNVIKYAEPKRVDISLQCPEEHLTMKIEDDGRGFSGVETARRRAEGHVGLSLLANAVVHAGGTLAIDSMPGRGTLVTLEMETHT